MTADRKLLQHALRRRRTSLRASTLLPSSSSRRGGFSAAMQQFEELMTASAAVGPASRPITLYYATVQAGHAVAAARKADPWSFSRHGLKLQNLRTPIADIEVAPEGVGAFQVVAQATGSPTLQEPVSLGALWSSLPDFEGMRLPSSSAPGSIGIYEDSDRDQPWVTVRIGYGEEVSQEPERQGPDEPSFATIIVADESPGAEEFEGFLVSLLSSYPGIEGFAVVGDSYKEVRDRRWTARLRWDRKIIFDEIAPAYRQNENRFLRPSLDSQTNRPPSPLMTWWAILYTFSMLSRYRPREWVAALDIDNSDAAYLLEYCLEKALDAIPHLVMEALDGRPTLFAMPLEL